MTVIVPSNSFIDSRISSGSRGPSSTIERRLFSPTWIRIPVSTHFSPTFPQLLFLCLSKYQNFSSQRVRDVDIINKMSNAIRTKFFKLESLLRNVRKKAVPPVVVWKGTACKFLTIFLRESYRVLHRSRDLCGDRIARPSSCGSRYVDYIVLAGGSSVRRCTKAWTMLAHTRIHAFPSTRPSHSLSLPLSPRVSAPLLFSYTPFRQCIVSLSLSHSPPSLSPFLLLRVLFTSEVHVSLSGFLVHFTAALFPTFVPLPHFL